MYNFGYYLNRVKHPETARIAVIRTEHIEKDWVNVENRVLKANVDPSRFSEFTRKNKSVKIEEDKILSEESLKNICNALCEEIQVYKTILNRAENLDQRDLSLSMGELFAKCPTEVSQSSCPKRDPRLAMPTSKVYSYAQNCNGTMFC